MKSRKTGFISSASLYQGIKKLFLSLIILSAIFNGFFQYTNVIKRAVVSFTSPFRLTEPDYRRKFDGDLIYFLQVGKAFTDGRWDIYNPAECEKAGINTAAPTYPPTAYFLAAPLSWLSPLQAGDLLIYTKTFSILASGLILALLLENRNKADRKSLLLKTFFLSIIIFFFSPSLEDYRWGQINLHLLFLMLLSLLFLTKGRDAGCGALLGLVFCIKFISAPFILYLIFKKRFKAVFYALGTIILINAALLMSAGAEPYISYFRWVPTKMPTWQTNFTCQNINCLLKMIYNSISTSWSPLWDAIPLIAFLFNLLFFTGTFYVLIKTIDNTDCIYPFCICLALVAFTSPINWAAHHVWLIPALMLLGWPLLESTIPEEPQRKITIAAGFIFIFLMAIDGCNVINGLGYTIRVFFLNLRLPFFLAIATWFLTAYGLIRLPKKHLH